MGTEVDTTEAVRLAYVELLGAERRLRGRDRLHKGGLTHAQIRTLFRIGAEGETTAGELARWGDLSPASVTVMLDHLEADGIVKRRRSETDRRVVVVSLTERGAALVEERRRQWHERWRSVLGDLPERDLEAAARVMRRLAAMLDEL